MKNNTRILSKISALIFSGLIIFSGIPAFAQGYQQPVDFENPGSDSNSYDELTQGNRGAGLGTASRPLKGRVVVAPAGSRFDATLVTTLSSGINRIGDIVNATVSSPLIVGSDVVIPGGSQVIGQVVNVIPAKRFRAGSGGVIEIRFTSIQTPDGQRYPLSASVDTSQFKLQAETGGSRLAKGVGKAAIGAGVGAALGTAIGAIAGGMPGRGAWSGAAIGGGTGALTALASKGAEFVLNSGERIPVVLDQSLQVVVPPRN
ncbi:MAG: hypothetical protein A3B68_03530 [Candidatus Melainabacteria bacterium RIFCSPHIGHO2_02_FULL_34_12]|nr:MAG: hypothetical protein A3B68_03530 [Candidatus Melainabacteria bacterium RIFCSPHIGHO2_02_FULL_34_12]